jgi:hypothetical protein
MLRLTGCLSGCLLASFLLPAPASAKEDPDLTQFNQDIRVEAGQKAGDVTCINCSIHVRGQVARDVTALHGNISIEEGGEVAGDVTTIWGNIRVDNGTRIAGDVTAVAGAARIQPQASVTGDRTSLEGTRWLLAIILPPLICIGLIVALIIWLVQRSRRPQMPAPVGQSAIGYPSTR